MTPAYAKKLGHQTQKTDVCIQKIDESSLDTFGIIIAGFQILNQQSCNAVATRPMIM